MAGEPAISLILNEPTSARVPLPSAFASLHVVPPAAPSPPARRGNVISIRWIVAGTVVALITAAVLAAGAVSERNTRSALAREVEARLLSQARNLALAGGDALLSDFPELTLHPLALEMKNRQPELALVVVLGPDMRILGDPDPRRLGSVFEPERALDPSVPRQPLRKGEQMLSDGKILVASVPVTHRDGRRIGTAMVGLHRSYLDGVINEARRQQSVVLAIVLAVGVAAATAVISLLLRPIAVLRSGIERIGRGDLDTPLKLSDRTEIGMLADAVNRMASQLRAAQSELVERERLAHELELARQIQSSLLPNRRCTAESFVIQGSNRAAQEVGGDYYDYFELPDGRIGIAIADVSGKGLGGCMVMSMLSVLLRAYRDADPSPASLLATLDEHLSETLQSGSFVTMFYGALDPRTGELTYANAGHSPVLVYRSASGRVESHRTRGIPLGAIRGGALRRTVQDETLWISPGDLLVQFTDGVNEAFEPSGREQFGFERLEEVVRTSARDGAATVLTAMHRSVEAWVGNGPVLDDETILVVSREIVVAEAEASAVPVALDPLELVAEARARGERIEFAARLQDLAELRGWLERSGADQGLEGAEFEIVCTALHEACANIAEHGYGSDASRYFELWRVPAEPADALAVPGARRHASLAAGYFLLRDQGKTFRAENWKGTDFTDRRAWKRGRGIGLDIIHRGMSLVSYHPATPEGNITVMTFDPAELRQKLKERRHA